jgi:hypothetical protein
MPAMGKNNRQRRADKRRQRTRSPRATGAGRAGDAEPGVADVVVAGAYAVHAGDDETFERAIEVLAARPPAATAADLGALIEQHVARAWTLGWQPRDLPRAVEKALGAREAEIVRRAICSEAETYRQLGARVAPEWMRQVEVVREAITIERAGSWLHLVAGDWFDVLGAAVRLTSMLMRLPSIARLVDPPREWRDGAVVHRASLPEGLLERVRALLAKAESTTFDAEAEAFTAKAQELMARHRIDRAVVDAAGAGAEEPIGRRVAIDNPYANAKATLLAQVAGPNGCRAVWSKDLGFSTVFGFASELDGVEELFTSLLVQATVALQHAGSQQDRSVAVAPLASAGRSSSRSPFASVSVSVRPSTRRSMP